MSTQTPHDPNHPKIKRVEVYWHTVTYKTVAVYVILLAAIVFAAIYLINPNLYTAAYDKLSKSIGNGDSEATTISQTQAKFVNLDGKVQVKKVNSVQWVDADFHTTLDKGDQIQTSFGRRGAHHLRRRHDIHREVRNIHYRGRKLDGPRAAFQFGGAHQHRAGRPRRRQIIASPDSKAAVSMEDISKAQLRSNSSAAVKSDPANKENEIVVSSGSAEVQRGPGEGGDRSVSESELLDGRTHHEVRRAGAARLEFAAQFRAADRRESENGVHPFRMEARARKRFPTRCKISTTAMFTRTVKEATGVTGTSADITGLDGGDYFWTVTATNAKKETSEVSETFRFTLVAQGKTQEMALEITGTQIHGRVVEIIGRTEPGAALIVNGQPVPIIAADGTFRHFTEPLEPGQHTIVIIGENRRGGTAQQKVTIVVPK